MNKPGTNYDTKNARTGPIWYEMQKPQTHVPRSPLLPIVTSATHAAREGGGGKGRTACEKKSNLAAPMANFLAT